MRARFLLPVLLALTAGAQASDTIEIGHRVIPDDGQAAASPMAWHYSLLQTARNLFDERAARQAPGATLSFRLPKGGGAQGANQVEIVQQGRHLPLPMVSDSAFALVRDNEARPDDALVVANQNFRKGSYNEPIVEVHSPGLPDGVRRMGDLRLACAAQMAMLKAEGFKVRTMLSAANLFGLDLCDEMDVTKIDAPTLRYDTVTIEDGGHRLVLPAKQAKAPRLGDQDWSDNARISYTLSEHGAQ